MTGNIDDLIVDNLLNKALNGIARWLANNRPDNVSEAESEAMLSEAFWRLIHWTPFKFGLQLAGLPDLCIHTGLERVVMSRVRVRPDQSDERRPTYRECLTIGRGKVIDVKDDKR
jgi:hypothetical protein